MNKIARLDPKTGKLDDFPVPSTDVLRIHSAVPAADGTVWFSEQFKNKIGRRDPKMKQVSEYESPTPGTTHTIRIDSKGMVWSTGNPLNRFDPETHKFTAFQTLPGARPSRYALGIDKSGNIWYASYYMDELGCLDPKTGKVLEYPYPHSENTLREFFPDDRGRLWYGSPSNDRVGYFYLADQ